MQSVISDGIYDNQIKNRRERYLHGKLIWFIKKEFVDKYSKLVLGPNGKVTSFWFLDFGTYKIPAICPPEKYVNILGEPAYPGSWPEDFNDENGNYLNKCCHCGNLFQGYKRRVVCKECANKATTPSLCLTCGYFNTTCPLDIRRSIVKHCNAFKHKAISPLAQHYTLPFAAYGEDVNGNCDIEDANGKTVGKVNHHIWQIIVDLMNNSINKGE